MINGTQTRGERRRIWRKRREREKEREEEEEEEVVVEEPLSVRETRLDKSSSFYPKLFMVATDDNAGLVVR